MRGEDSLPPTRRMVAGDCVGEERAECERRRRKSEVSARSSGAVAGMMRRERGNKETRDSSAVSLL